MYVVSLCKRRIIIPHGLSRPANLSPWSNVMEQGKLRTVIATADRLSARPIVESLVSCSADICAFAGTGMEVIEQVHEIRPDLIVADLILPGADGLDLARQIMNMSLDRRPGVILLDPTGQALTRNEWLFDCGVIIIAKHSASNIISQSIAAVAPEKRKLPPEHRNRLNSLLDELGVPFHPGRNYIADAVGLVWADIRYMDNLKKRLYASVARKHSTDAAKVERAMRYAIDSAWRTGEISSQHNIFGDTIDARRGKPTCGEMIARLADILRWEGRK